MAAAHFENVITMMQIERPTDWDTSNRQEFFDYYAEASGSDETLRRFRILRDALLKVYLHFSATPPVDVLDIGCNGGPLSRVFAEQGCQVTGIDISEPLLELARERARNDGHEIDFRVGSATELPAEAESFDICCMPELLEHIEDWETCLNEAIRVLRPGGLIIVSTTNCLCPVQQEFTLPLYSWYPGFIKRRCERLAKTTRPELANHATYPALHWFSYYGLRRYFCARGFDCLDRFDVAAMKFTDRRIRWVLNFVRSIPGLRLIGHICTPGTFLVGRKQD